MFKMEIAESIRASLIPGEWVASIDLSDVYFHIPIHPNSRKYLTQTLGWIINQEKSEVKPTQVFFVHGLRIPFRFGPCKTHSREMAQTSGFDPTLKVKTCFDCKMFDVANWVAYLNGEYGTGGMPS